MSLRQAVLASSFAVAQVNALQLDTDRAKVHPLIDERLAEHGKFVNWNLCKNPASHNNLGGLGPKKDDPEEMRVTAVKKVTIGNKEHVLDLVVKVAEGSEYKANNPEVNKVEGCMGYINVQTGGEAKLDFRFTPTGENKTWEAPDGYVPTFKFTILDMDGSKSGIKEEVTFETPIDHLYRSDPHVWHFHGENTPEDPYIFDSGGIIGNGADNPKMKDGIVHLEPEQADRAITVLYKGITEWSVKFRADGKPKRKPTGRNFMWTGASDVPDIEACPEWAAPTFPWSLCQSALTSNNLGGQGPDGADDENAEPEIRYSSVAKVKGQTLDLRVTAEDGYSPYNVSRNTVITDRSYAGIHGCFGAINVKATTKVRLTFAFVDHKTGEVAKIEKDEGFGFSVFDVDQSNEAGNEERVHFDTPYAHEAFEGEHVEKVADAERTFHSTSFGKGSDNIYDEADANSDVQMSRTVKVMYNGEMTGGEALWTVTFDVRGGLMGRNFLFGGCVHELEDVAHPE